MLGKAFLATLILGTSTIAAAQPGPWEHRDRDRDRYDHARYGERYDRDGRYDNGDNRNWFPVAENISFYSRSAKRAPDQQIVHIGAERGRVDALMFEGTGGRNFISRVFVRYADGSGETIGVNRVLMRGDSAVVRLSRDTGVKAIIVFTQPSYYGAARDDGSTFTVLAST